MSVAMAMAPFAILDGPGAAAEEGLEVLEGESYEVIDGVRRAKAASELGQETIAAEVQIGGKTVASGRVPISSLLSQTRP
jgi:hypothetical protein